MTLAEVRVAGIDLSLTGTGVVTVQVNDDVADWEQHLIKTKGTKSDTLYQRHGRLTEIVEKVAHIAIHDAGQVDLAVIESPSFGSVHGAQHDRSGLWWLVVSELRLHGVPVATVTPNGRAKYGTGKGNAAKDQVLVAAAKAYPWLDITDNNVGDATILAAMGARHLGFSVDDDSMTQAKLAAMDGAAWPT